MTFASLTAVLEGYYAAFNLPIWLTGGQSWANLSRRDALTPTEYALTFFGSGTPPPPATQDEIDQFMRESTAWLDAQPWVERYFWFGAMYEMVSCARAERVRGGGGWGAVCCGLQTMMLSAPSTCSRNPDQSHIPVPQSCDHPPTLRAVMPEPDPCATRLAAVPVLALRHLISYLLTTACSKASTRSTRCSTRQATRPALARCRR